MPAEIPIQKDNYHDVLKIYMAETGTMVYWIIFINLLVITHTRMIAKIFEFVEHLFMSLMVSIDLPKQ